MPANAIASRILIVRLGAMGDILHALPAVTALRAALPLAYIAWAVEPRWVPLLSAHSDSLAGANSASADSATSTQMPVVNRVWPVPAKRWSRTLLSPRTFAEIRALTHALPAQKFDLAIDLQGAVRSAIIAKLARATRIAGEAAPREPIARHLFDLCVATCGVHVVDQALEVTSAAIGLALPLLAPALPIDAAAEMWRDELCGGTPYIVINPGAGWGAKRWPPERYAEVARAFAKRGYEVFINASTEERELGETVVAESARDARLVVCSIGELTSLLRQTSLFIGGDTGPLHLAAALQRRSVGIYGPTDPARNGPFATLSRVLRHPASKRDHSRRTETEAGLMTITASEVIEAGDELLAATEAHS